MIRTLRQKLSARHLVLLLLFMAVVAGFPSSVLSQESGQNSNGGVTISPAFQDLIVPANKSRVEGQFTLTNNESLAVRFSISTVDMGALDDTGGLIFSGLPSDYQKRFGLAEWLKIPSSEIVVPAKKSQEINFFIDNTEDFQPGGHYGAIIVRPESADDDNSNNKVNLSPQAASLLFVRKIGGEVYRLKLAGVQTPIAYRRPPVKLTVDLQNDGNVHVTPRGIVEIKNWRGDTIGQGVINTASTIVLPERGRPFNVDITYLKRPVWPGKYKAVVQYRFDGQEAFQTTETTFWIINPPLILITTIGVVAITWAVRFLHRKYGYLAQNLRKNVRARTGKRRIGIVRKK